MACEADPIDMATRHAEMMLGHQIEAQRKRATLTPRLWPIGYCQNPRCGDDFPRGDQRLFCNSGCAK